MFCRNCGIELNSHDGVCQNCGENNFANANQNNQQGYQQYYQNNQQPYNPYQNQQPQDQPYNPYFVPNYANMPATTALKVLSFFFPIVGIILFIIDRDQKPRSAKECLKMSLISIGVSVAFAVVFCILIFLFAVNAPMYY